MKYLFGNLLRAGLSVVPSLLRRVTGAMAIALLLVAALGVVTGIIPDAIAALRSDVRAWRDRAKATEVAATYAVEQAEAAAVTATISRKAREAEARSFEAEVRSFEEKKKRRETGIPVNELGLSINRALAPHIADPAKLDKATIGLLMMTEKIAALDDRPETLNREDINAVFINSPSAQIIWDGNYYEAYSLIERLFKMYDIRNSEYGNILRIALKTDELSLN